MPSTLPTHPLAVLPLKLWRPRWFDGVALATGACAPDFAYALDGFGVNVRSHTIPGMFWWGLPTAILVAWLARFGAPVVAAHLPSWLRDFGVLGRVRHRWFVTVWSALIGVASHLLFDLVTHPGPVAAWYQIRRASDGWAVLLTPLLLWYIGRRRLLRDWHGPAPEVPRAPIAFWGVAAGVAALGFGATWLLGYHGVHVVGVRLMASVAGGLLCAAAALQWARAAGDRPSRPAPVPPG
ncbi:DUF4184 family protein [Dactylosporangium sp. AC04546]|uniref:DUF4184 family protein n=1 Tax=Dactylosporangium sp. AC04546 TaxID=2862460 RepID=UPI001EDFF4DB|nr:DUF4184 family protein [Dactylosporangium sp. AC04546]WVK85610.1 DUF4184 family protein [Dactylosporangium sp. AC04546]